MPFSGNLGGCTGSLNLYVEDVDVAFERALAARAQVKMPVHGYRKDFDPFGHEWGIGTHIEDLSEEEVMHRAKAAFAEMAKVKKHRSSLENCIPSSRPSHKLSCTAS
jgi:PhnB protein